MNSQVLQDEKWLLVAGIYDAIEMGSAKLPPLYRSFSQN